MSYERVGLAWDFTASLLVWVGGPEVALALGAVVSGEALVFEERYGEFFGVYVNQLRVPWASDWMLRKYL